MRSTIKLTVMIWITKIIYFFNDKPVKIEKPPHTEVANKEQLEKLREVLIKNTPNCTKVNFTYEEYD